ncbi:unnamed protein product [Pedinophyceae sp. YPF-701]|nr:unnamed protein product [Pedinophyceae sp. YPF-701]
MDARLPVFERVGKRRRSDQVVTRLILVVAALGVGTLCTLLLVTSSFRENKGLEKMGLSVLSVPSAAFCHRSAPPLVCADGGDVDVAPPNTREAIAAALDAGVTCIQLDLARSKDGELMLIHDEDILRLLGADSKMAVADLPAKEISALRYDTGESPADARSTLEWLVADARAEHVIVDVRARVQPIAHAKLADIERHRVAEELAESALGLIEATRCTKCMAWASDEAVVRRIRERNNSIKTGYVMPSSGGVGGLTEGERSAGLSGPHLKTGRAVHAWVADSPRAMARVLDAGVDAIVTAHPKELLQAVRLLRRKCEAMESWHETSFMHM